MEDDSAAFAENVESLTRELATQFHEFEKLQSAIRWNKSTERCSDSTPTESKSNTAPTMARKQSTLRSSTSKTRITTTCWSSASSVWWEPNGFADRDIVVFVNGLPLAVVELKNPSDASADVWKAYSHLQTYKDETSDQLAYNVTQAETLAMDWSN